METDGSSIDDSTLVKILAQRAHTDQSILISLSQQIKKNTQSLNAHGNDIRTVSEDVADIKRMCEHSDELNSASHQQFEIIHQKTSESMAQLLDAHTSKGMDTDRRFHQLSQSIDALSSQISKMAKSQEGFKQIVSKRFEAVGVSLEKMENHMRTNTSNINHLKAKLDACERSIHGNTLRADEESKDIEQLQQSYNKLLPYVQKMFVNTKRQQATDALHELNRSSRSSSGPYGLADRYDEF